MMAQALRGKTVEQLKRLFEGFHELLTGDDEPSPDLGKLQVFSGVRKFPVRVKCATLGWHTLNAALASSAETVTTE